MDSCTRCLGSFGELPSALAKELPLPSTASSSRARRAAARSTTTFATGYADTVTLMFV